MKFNLIIFALALLSLGFTACEVGEDLPLTDLEGTYDGTFQRTVGNEPGEVSRVSITFKKNSWEGQSERAQYPALCKGSYKINGSVVSFDNHCFFTADFDWTLILKGEFEIKRTENKLTFTKILGSSEEQIKDVYTFMLGDVRD